MSNHSGSYMLNSVLELLYEYSFFEKLSKKKSHKFIKEIINISHNNDGNTYEVLEGLAAKLGFCYLCNEMKDPKDFQKDEDLCITTTNINPSTI